MSHVWLSHVTCMNESCHTAHVMAMAVQRLYPKAQVCVLIHMSDMIRSCV